MLLESCLFDQLPLLSAEVSGKLSLDLKPGWYALIFGSGLFGADGFGVAVRNGSDLDNPAYLGGQATIPDFWWDLPSMFTGQRFFIEGQEVPEPQANGLLTSCLMIGAAGLRLRIGRKQRLDGNFKKSASSRPH